MPLSRYDARLARKIALELLNEFLVIECDGEYHERYREEADKVFHLHGEYGLYLIQLNSCLFWNIKSGNIKTHFNSLGSTSNAEIIPFLLSHRWHRLLSMTGVRKRLGFC